MVIEGTIPGGFQAASDVLARDGYLYFRGTDDAVWRVNATCPSDNTNYGGPQVVAARSNVFPADDGYLYFRGRVTGGRAAGDTDAGGTGSGATGAGATGSGGAGSGGPVELLWILDNAVCRISATNPDDRGTIDGFETHSDVYVRDGYACFQGTDGAVWRVNVADPADRTNYGGPEIVSTRSSVYPAEDGYLYFRGTCQRGDSLPGSGWRGIRRLSRGGKLFGGRGSFAGRGIFGRRGIVGDSDASWRDDAVCRVKAGSPSAPAASRDRGTLGSFAARSAIFARGGYAYFRGTDNAVWRVSTANPGDHTNYGGPGVVGTLSAVFPAEDGYLYFRDPGGKARRMSAVPADGAAAPGGAPGETPGDFTAGSGVFYADGHMHFQGADRRVYRYGFRDGSLTDHATAAVLSLQNWYQDKTGLWKTLHGPAWWNSANALYALIDYMSLTGTYGYTHVIENTFARCGGDGFLNDYYDDEGWWALAWINASDFTPGPDRKQDYLTMARAIFTDMETGWVPETCDGGVIWKKGNPGKNSVENEVFLAVAVRLYERVPEPDRAYYLEWIERAGNWFYEKFIVASPDHLIYDGLTSAGQYEGHTQTFTYDQGVILGALADMDANQLSLAGQRPADLARRIADAAITHLSHDGVLTEYGGASAGNSSDLPQFKGIFMRNLGYLAAYLGPAESTAYADFIRRNTDVLLTSGRNALNQYGYRWQGPFDAADSSRQTSALEAFNAALRLAASAKAR